MTEDEYMALALQKYYDLQQLKNKPTFYDYEKSFDAIWQEVEYVTYLGRQRSFFTVQRHLASLAKYHRLNELESPTTNEQFKVFMKGFKLKKTVRQKQAPDFSLKELRKVLDLLPATPTGLRNRAILLLGFTGAFRRSELAQLNIENLLIDEAGMVIRLDRSKTNQFGEVEEKRFPMGRIMTTVPSMRCRPGYPCWIGRRAP